MQTQQKSCFRIQSRQKQHKEFYPVVAAFSAGFPACAHLLSLNTVNSISSRTGCVKHNLSENDIFLRGLSARIRRYGELVPLPLLSHPRGPHANPAKRFAWGKGAAAEGVSFAAGGEAKDLELAATLSRCGLGACRGAKRPFRETCRWASPSLFFRLHGLLAPLCAYPTRFLSRCGGCATPHCLPLREKHLAPAAQLLFRLRGALCSCSTGPRASCYISFAELIFTPGPMVEAHTQERMY